MNKNANRWKKIVYEYDLISGKVNKVMYQPRYSDQFTHRYFYDAENRLTEVQTSLDGFTWEREAKYEYYLHGPLARTVFGQQQVQGMDYAYTLQGWLKGVNSTGATATHDIGADGQLSSLNKYVARDALGFNLNYFHGDFQPINPGVSPFPAYRLPSKGLPDSVYRPLYNGNISSMATRIRKFDTLGHLPVLYNYKYDQLNRLAKQDAFFNFNAAANTYYNADSTRWKPDSTFNEQIRYDANGNIQQYKRYAIGPNSRMDDLSYKYYPGTNRLKQVNDVIPDNSYGTNPLNPVVDIDNQVDSNYIYDSIGNLIRDKAEKITNIQWNVYGKITEITRNSLTTDRVTTTRTRYTYDAQGNRISKVTKYYNKDSAKYKLDYTWYVRDAQGNLLSTYTVDRADTSVADLGTLALKQADVQLYGSSRLGNLPPRNSVVDQASNTGPWINPVYRGTTYYRGDRQYELTNHLGNVLTTISDRKIPVYSGSSLNLPGGFTVPIADYFEPDMVSATDYYPFGMVSRGIGPSDKYRFGFNGKENDNEVKGFAQQQDYGMRVYDPRVGRFLSVDPLTDDYPSWSPYPFAMNRPIDGIDLDGMEWMPTKDKNGTITGYNWVGYNKDGSAKEGSVSGGVVNSGKGYNIYYTSNSATRSGQALFMGQGTSEILKKDEIRNPMARMPFDVSITYQDRWVKEGGLISQERKYVDVTATAWNDNGSSELFSDRYSGQGISPSTFNSPKAFYNNIRYGLGFADAPAGGALEVIYPETIFLPLPKGLGLLGKAATTSEGFLLGSIGFKLPFNLRVGLYASENTLKYGTFKWSTIAPESLAKNEWFGRRMLQITTEFQPVLGKWSSQIIPKGTYIKIGLVGPQKGLGLGSWLQIYAPKGVNFFK